MQIISILKDLIFIGCALTGAIVAVKGLSAWKDQLSGSTEYELARSILRLTYRLRNAINQLRSPFFLTPSIPKEKADTMTPEQIKQYELHLDYKARKKKIMDIILKLDPELVETEVLWGKEFKERYSEIYNLLFDLYDKIEDYIDLNISNVNREERKEEFSKIKDIIFKPTKGKEDDFDKKLNQAINVVEEYLKNYIKKK